MSTSTPAGSAVGRLDAFPERRAGDGERVDALRLGAKRSSKTDALADEDHVDAAWPLLVDLEDLADRAVLAVGSEGAGVLERQAVLEDPLTGRFRVGDELLRTDGEDHAGRAPGVGGELAARE